MAVQTRSLALSSRLGRVIQSRQLITHIGIVALCSVGVKATGMVRDVILASEFGTSDAADAFIAAWALPQMLAGITGSALAGVIVPWHAEAHRQGGDERARRFLSEITIIAGIALALLTLLLLPLRDLLLPLLTSSFGPEKLAQTERLWALMLPAVFLYAMIMGLSAVLNTSDRFTLPAALPLIVPLTTIGALWVYPQGGIEAPAAGFVIGNLFHGGGLLWGLHQHDMDIIPSWHGGLTETKGALVQVAPFLANGIVFDGIGIVDQAMAATLGQGNLATLSYGNKLIIPVLSIGSMALATVVYPRFSRMVAAGEWDRLYRQVRIYLGFILMATIPAMIACVLLSSTIVRVLFERGAFTAADTAAVSDVQATYALMIPAYVISLFLSRVLNAMRATRIIVIGSVGIFVVNLICDYLFKEWIGVWGIALATVINYLIALAFNAYVFRRLMTARLAEIGAET